MLSALAYQGQFAIRLSQRPVYREKEVPQWDRPARPKCQGICDVAGKVIAVGQDRVSGKFVTLQHGNFTVSYCHLSRITVSQGQVVRAGAVVGVTGNTGRSTGEHLHITCKYKGETINPSIIFSCVRQS